MKKKADTIFEKKFDLIIVVVFAVAVLMAVVSLVLYFVQIDYFYIKLRGSWGEFGDYIGGVLNPAYSFLALLVLLITLFLQNKDIKESRSFSVQQLFESSFYNLLGLYSDIVDDLEEKIQSIAPGEKEGLIYKGRDCFRYYYEKKIKKGWVSNDFMIPKEIGAKDRFDDFNEKYGYKIGHYFRVLYRIYKYIDDSSVKNKDFYSGIVRAQLSSYELIVMFYNCLSEDGAKFKKYAEKYALFENMSENIIDEIADDLMLYGSSNQYEKYFGDNRFIEKYRFEEFETALSFSSKNSDKNKLNMNDSEVIGDVGRKWYKRLSKSTWLTIIGGSIIFWSWIAQNYNKVIWDDKVQLLQRSQLVVDIEEVHRSFWEKAFYDELRRIPLDTLGLANAAIKMTRSRLDLYTWGLARVSDDSVDNSVIMQAKYLIDSVSGLHLKNRNYRPIFNATNAIDTIFTKNYPKLNYKFFEKADEVRIEQERWQMIYIILYVFGSILLGFGYILKKLSEDKYFDREMNG